MNEARLRICGNPEWAAFVENELLPWIWTGASSATISADLAFVQPSSSKSARLCLT
jgi:hypothetical protein